MVISSTVRTRLALVSIGLGLASLFVISELAAQPGITRPGISRPPKMPGPPKFETTWTCPKCANVVASGKFSRPPATCQFCGARFINGSGGLGVAPPVGPNPLIPPVNPNPLRPRVGSPIVRPNPAPGPEATKPDSDSSGGLSIVPSNRVATPEYTTSPPSSPAAATDIGSKVYLAGMRSTVQVVCPLGGDKMAAGTGSVINLKNGLVLTNWHVVRGAQGDMLVLFPLWHKAAGRPVVEEAEYQRSASTLILHGQVLASEEKCDLAIIKLHEPSRIPQGTASIRFSATSPLAGSKIYSIGNPAASDSMWVYTPGEVRNVYKKKWTAKGGGGERPSNHEVAIIEATSPTNPGDSGGPCYNDKGEQVGVTQGGLNSTIAQGFSYFVDVSDVRSFFARNNVSFNVASDSVPEAPAELPVTNPSAPARRRAPDATTSTGGGPLFGQFSAMNSAGDNESTSGSPASSSGGGGKAIAIILISLSGLALLGFLTYVVIFKSSATKTRQHGKKRRRRDYDDDNDD